MTMALAWLLAIFAAVLLTTVEGEAIPKDCHCEGPSCDTEPKGCGTLGTARVCGRKVCRKGLHESCGGPANWKGICADTLKCIKYICIGCIILHDGNFDCSR